MNEIKKRKLIQKIKRLAVIIVLFIILCCTLLLAISPQLIRNYLNKNGEELTGRLLQIDKIKINYFTSTLKVLGAELYEKNNSDVFLGFDTLMLNLKPLRLLKNEIYVEQFQLVSPHAQIIQNENIYNFSDLIEFFSSDSTLTAEPTDTADTKSYKLNLNLLEIKNGSFSFVDGKMEHELAMEEVSFVIPHIYWGAEQNSNADISFKMGRGGSFRSNLDYNTKTGFFSGSANLSQLELEAFLPYLKQYVLLSDIDGNFSADLNFNGIQSDMEQLMLNGTARIDDLKVKDEEDKEVLGIDSAGVELKEFKPLQYHLEIDRIQIDEPYVYFALIDSTSNFEKLLVQYEDEDEPETLEKAESEKEEIPKQVILNRFVVNSGLIDFRDQRLREVFDYELSEVTIDMDTITLQDDWINIIANMKLNKRGSLEAKLGLNPADPLQRIDLEYVLTDFQLPDINIYSKHYTGLPILFGEMYYISKTSIVERKLQSDNELIITNVEMGRKTGGLYDIPIKLALFILKDINGDIVLDIPVSGDLSDPKMKIGPIIWDTFKGFMFKIVASPFKAFGNLLGADPEELEEITFNYDDTTLLAKQKRGLDLLLKLEDVKLGIQIDMQYLNDKKLEKVDAAETLMKQRFYKKHNKKADQNRKDYLEFLKEESGQDSLLMQDYELLLVREELVDSLIQQRESQRLKLVRDYFVNQGDSTSIRVFGYNSNEVLNMGSRPRFLIKYTLAEDAK